MQDKLKSMPRPTNLQILENHLILAWRGISPDTGQTNSQYARAHK